MGRESRRNPAEIWRLAARQHGVISRRQLLSAGLSCDQIDTRIGRGRLHRTWRGVYAVGRPQLTLRGWWMAAVLACGDHALLSHDSAAALWAIRTMKKDLKAENRPPPEIHLSVLGPSSHSRPRIRIHRRTALPPGDRTQRDGIPVTSPARTRIDLGARLNAPELESAVNEADKLGLIDPETLRSAVDDHRGVDGVPALRKVLDRRTFRLTDSDLERRFMRLVERAGLPPPLTQQQVNGFRVDFFWPELGLVVETDGLRYHRTATEQSRDRIRDQAHVAAGLATLRFTHEQIRFEPGEAIATLRKVTERCRLRFVGSPGR
jgi:very-short-patch-repair endonuclease